MMQKPFLLSRPVPAAIFIIIAVVLDQVIKYLVEVRLPFQAEVPVVPYLSLYRTWNEGVAFSFLSGMNGWAIIGMRLLIVAFILWWWRNARQAGGLMHLGFAMIVAGAVGNIIDRFIYGHVVDYVLFHTHAWSFAVFNLADSLITMGAVVVGFSELFLGKNGREGAN
jgi:signal peptidase II